ncbi:hypothetical protein M3Y97_00870900 [Aphelenchoides bicaudatus]|nr:hypothetical protein M3Y97_00870900 [Aphelenchoides bicaudatus]
MCGVLIQHKMNGVLSKSAVIRARYLPDVNGVNRYKYFHRPLIPDKMVGVVCPQSIDSKKAPKRAELLPPILRPTIKEQRQRANGLRTATVDVEKSSAISSNKNARTTSKKKSTSNGDSSPSKTKKPKQKQPQELSATNLNAVASSSTLPPIAPSTKLYATKRLNATWPSNEDSVPNGRMHNNKVSNNNAFIEAGISKRAQSVSSLRTTDMAFLGKGTTRASSSWNHRQKAPIKDFGTQTDSSANQTLSLAPTIVAPEPIQIDEFKQANNTPKATQTNNIAVLTRLSMHSFETVHDIEQRSKLLEIVDDALNETIDKNSRQRVNELIVSSARKQAEVWRDAKVFVSSVLLPESVAAANRARSKRLPIEAIANVHFP